MDYTPITTEEAIDAVLKGEKLEGREIPDLRALIEGIQRRASEFDEVELACDNCRIFECQCKGLGITFAAYFVKSTFTHAVSFSGATFTKRARFDGATFTKEARFDGATFTEEADFRGATFTEGADFAFTTFTKRADFRGATFTRVAFFGAATFTKNTALVGNLAGADFRQASFNGCSLNEEWGVANLERANLVHTRGLILNSTPIRNARFSPRASDPWSQLRRAYTGPRLVFTLMFLVAFFMPYVLKTAAWVSVNRVQEEFKQHVEEMRDRVEALESEEHVAARPLTVALEAVADRLPHDNDDRWQTKSVWELVIGMDKKWTYWVTAIVLLAYNLCRAVLTWFVAPMRDAEERSGVSPAYRRDTSNAPERGDGWKVATWPARWILWWSGTWTDSYRWLILPHRFARLVLLLAVISFCLHAVHWLRLPVILPA